MNCAGFAGRASLLTFLYHRGLVRRRIDRVFYESWIEMRNREGKWEGCAGHSRICSGVASNSVPFPASDAQESFRAFGRILKENVSSRCMTA